MKRLVLFFLFLLLLCPHAARAAGIIRDQEIEQSLKAMSAPVFDQAGVSGETVKFYLVEEDALNAFVAGGQNIFLNTGLIMKTRNPEELLGVIAHETGHIALGHLFRMHEAAERTALQALLSSAIGIAVAAGTRSGEAGYAATRAGMGMAVNTALSHSRSQESAADQAGVRYLSGARMPVTGFLSFMEQMASQELLPTSQQAQYVRTHPLTQERIAFLKNTAAEQAARGRGGSMPAEFAGLHGRIRAKLMGYLAPDRTLADKSEGFEADYARAIARYRKGQMTKAVAQIDALIRAEPRNPWLHELKAQVLFESGRGGEALASYARALELEPGAGLVRAAYGHALLEAGRFREAAAQLRKSLDAEPHLAQTHHFLAVAYGRMGEEGLSRLHLAEEYALKRRKDLARREARMALDKLPKGSPGALRAQDILNVVESEKDKEKNRDKDGGGE